ncbi:MAG: GMC family oxidoreductase [Paracoccus sp. (in: a-proteobacteria)]|nr:GMC family oxidoreductase [Paracoccus sp. (in: a-proteobacteria)]
MDADLIIIGSGMGGATLAAGLAPSGRRILILETGERMADSPDAVDGYAIHGRGVYRPAETWLDGQGQPFSPGNFYYVGGNTKFYGAVLLRYRESDFSPIRHMGGTTPGWPISYAALEPWYQAAETMYQVRGHLGDDPTEPAHSGDYPFPPLPDEPEIADLRRRLRRVGLHPSFLPLGVDLERWLERAKIGWDGYPNTIGGKMDAETIGIAQALRHPNVTLLTGTRAERLECGPDGAISAVLAHGPQGRMRLEAPLIALAAGAVNSVALLLRSADDDHPAGLANRSDQLGRNFMNHNCSAVLAIHPFRRNRSIYQKTLMVNDFYETGGPNGEPLGNIQMLGRVTGPILAAGSGLPFWLSGLISGRALDLYAMSEDLPDPESRVSLKDGRIMLDWKRSNWSAHQALVARLKKELRRAGYPVVLSKPFDRRTPSHQCGTARMGRDPSASVTDIFGRSHDHPNLFITDASVLPTSAAVNPALTVAALSLRAGDHIRGADWA